MRFFDWDMCTIGEPLVDLGTLLSLWFEIGEEVGDPTLENLIPTKTKGFMTRKEAVERYANKSGFDVSKINYFYCFGMFKIAVVLQQIYYRYSEGQTNDERFKNFDTATELIMDRTFDQTKMI